MRAIATRTFAALTLAIGLAAVFAAPPASAAGVPYVVGDVFAADSNGIIKHFSPTGVLLDTLNTLSNSNEVTGMCFGESGNLRSTNFTTNNMTLFDNMGNVLTFPWAGPFSTHPESCVLNAAGDIYVGQVDGSNDVLKFDPSGALLASYNVVTGPRGSDWIDLAADQCTLYYTSEGPTIRRFDVCTNTQLPNFATNFTASGFSTVCFALRIRPNGEVMVACSNKIYRLDAVGTVIQSYPLPAGETSFVFALNLDPDNVSFWTAGFNSGNIYRIVIDTGVVITQFAAGSPVKGLAIFGEITVARPPASLTLEPETDTNPVSVGGQHCVTATVRDATAQPLQGVTVVFSVTGTAGNSASGSVDTDANGEAQFCYTGPTAPGVDAIHAYADSNKNGVQDTGEPFADATKTWVAGAPATITLTPPNDTNTAGEQHCVTATVRDQFGNPVPGVTVGFNVFGANPTTGVVVTDANGQAVFCYTGTVAGEDEIFATALGTTIPSASAQKTWLPGDPATLVLTPPTDTNTVDDTHCVTATVRDAFGNPTPGITVRFSVTGSVTTSGSAVTDANGQATFCYTSALPGADVITAYADTDNDGVRDAGEPQGTAAKTWVIPASTEGCKVTYGGRITAANGDKATFGGNAKADGLTGQEEYQDHGPAADMNVHSIDVLSVVCSRDGTQASIFGTATIDGSGTFNYRIDLKDLGEPGSSDTYRIRLSNGYDSLEQVLKQGNVQIH